MREEDGAPKCGAEAGAAGRDKYNVRMWGYLPAASSQRAPLLQPTSVPPSTAANDPLKSVCNGGCGFAVAISESGKLNTWGSTTDLGQCYLISGKQQECPEPYSLDTESPIIQAAAGWAHCAAVTGVRPLISRRMPFSTIHMKSCPVFTTEIGDCFHLLWFACHQFIIDDFIITSGVNTSGGDVTAVIPGVETRFLLYYELISEEGLRAIWYSRYFPRALLSGGLWRPVRYEGSKRCAIDEHYACEGSGEVFTWGWSECVPSVKSNVDESDQMQADETSPGSSSMSLQGSPQNNVVPALAKANLSASPLKSTSGLLVSSKQTGRPSHRNLICKTSDSKGAEEVLKKRKVVSFDDGGSPENPTASEDNVFAPPCVVNLDPGIRIRSVAAGGRHTLALSDGGRVWGWGYGGEGQLGLGSRMRIVSSPQEIPCIIPAAHDGTRSESATDGMNVTVPGSYVKAIACGGRHSAVITDAGSLLTFGWGLYGQVGQGSTEDELSPSYVSSMGGLHVTDVAAGLWHTLCITESGDIYACGGNQFGQLGVGGNQAEMCPRLIDAPLLEDERTVAVACGARHSVVLTGTGKVFSWGWNKYGQLGLGDSNNRDLPVQVTMNDGERVARIACGWWHTLAAVLVK